MVATFEKEITQQKGFQMVSREMLINLLKEHSQK